MAARNEDMSSMHICGSNIIEIDFEYSVVAPYALSIRINTLS